MGAVTNNKKKRTKPAAKDLNLLDFVLQGRYFFDLVYLGRYFLRSCNGTAPFDRAHSTHHRLLRVGSGWRRLRHAL